MMPDSWIRLPMEQLAADEPGSLTDGPFGSNLKTSHYTAQGPRVIRLQNIGDGVFHDEEAHISEEHFVRLRKHEAAADDVVIAMLGETLPRACLVPSHIGPAIVKADCVRLRVQSMLASSRYVAHALNSQQVRRQASSLVHGVGRPRLGLQWLRTLEVPLAPRAEQQRIVEAIESYFTRLDDVVATLERAQRNLKRYRASVLKAAVEGRLVPTEAEVACTEGRDYEPASALLERILAERRRRWEEAELAKMNAKGNLPKDDKWKAKYKEPVAPKAAGLPLLPEGWLWATLTQLFETVTDGDHQPPPQSRDGVPFLVISNVRAGRVEMEGTRFVTREYYDSLHEARRPRSGDLLYTVTGSYGIPVRVVDDAPFCVQRHIAILRPSVYSNPDYLYYALQSQPVLDQANRSATGTAQKTVGLGSLREFVVPLPPSDEQSRIVASLEAQFSVADNNEYVVGASAVRSGRVRQSILKWAFEGRLVDQDPTDEPASKLLERILAERGSTKETPRRRVHKTLARTPQA